MGKKGIKIFAGALAAGILLTGSTAVHAQGYGLEKYGMLPIYGRDIEDGSYPVEIEFVSDDIEVEKTVLHVENGEMELTLSVEKPEKMTVTGEIEALNRVLSCEDVFDGEWDGEWMLLHAESLPKEAMKLSLPDYEMIEEAVQAWRKENGEQEELEPVEAAAVDLEDGEYSISLDMAGGSGKASVVSPTLMYVREGKAYVHLTWSSSHYDYMLVGTEKYLNESAQDVNSTFTIPIACFDREMPVIADTTAMGAPREIRYTMTFYEETIGSKGQLPQEAAKRVVLAAAVIIVAGGILNACVKKKRRC